MKYDNLNITSKKSAKRVGRGIASGKGKTAGRGTKGQGSRAGSTRRPGFSGGQNPMMQQLPKLPGFRSYRSKAELVFTDQLDELKVKTIDSNTLFENHLVSNPFTRIKLLFRGEIKSAITVKLPSASTTAIDALQKSGGEFNKVPISQKTAKAKENEEK